MSSKFRGHEDMVDTFFKELKKNGYSDDQIEKSKVANEDLNAMMIPVKTKKQTAEDLKRAEENKTSYLGGALKSFNEGFNNTVMQPLNGAAKLVSDLTGLESPVAFGDIGNAIVKDTKENNVFGSSNMPDNIGGDILGGVAQTLPMIATLGLTPELKIAGLSEATGGLIKAVPKFSTQMAATGFLNEFNKSENFAKSAKAGIEGFEEGAIIHGLGMSAQGFGALAKEMGAGKLTSAAAAATANGLFFGGYQGAKEYAEKGSIDPRNFLGNVGTGMAFSIPELTKVLVDKAQNNAMVNYFTTPLSQINQFVKLGLTPKDLRDKAQGVGEELLKTQKQIKPESEAVKYWMDSADEAGQHFSEGEDGKIAFLTSMLQGQGTEKTPAVKLTEQNRANIQKALDILTEFKKQDDKSKALTIAQQALNSLADASALNQAMAEHPQQYIDMINADETLTPEQKKVYTDKITESAQDSAAQKTAEQTKVNHISDMKALESPDSKEFFDKVDQANDDITIIDRVKNSLNEAVLAGELSPEEAQVRIDYFRKMVDVYASIPKEFGEGEDRMAAGKLLNKEANLKESIRGLDPRLAADKITKVKRELQTIEDELNRMRIENKKGKVKTSDLVRAPLSEYEQKVSDALGKDLTDNYEERKKEYKAKHGNVFDTDRARDFSPEYRDNPELLSNAVHLPAREFVNKMYQEELAKKAPEGKENEVTFMAGGSGVGKSHTANNGEINSQIVVDTNLSTFDRAAKDIDEALVAGKKVNIAWTYRDPVKAFVEGVMGGKHREGRTVPYEVATDINKKSLETIKQLSDHYKDNKNVEFRYIDNNGEKGNQKLISLDDVKKITFDYDQAKKDIRNEIERQHNANEISDSQYHGFLGDIQEGLIKRAKEGRLGRETPESIQQSVSGGKVNPSSDQSKNSVPPTGKMLLTHKAIDAVRKALGLDFAEKEPSDKFADFEEAKNRYIKNPDQAKQIIADHINARKGATRVEAYIVRIHMAELLHEGILLNDKLSSLKSSGKATPLEIDTAYGEQQVNLMNYDIASRVAKDISSEFGKGLESAKDAITDDITLDNTLSTARTYAKDGKLTPEQEADYKDMQTKLDAAEKALKDYKEQAAKKEAEGVFNDELLGEKPKSKKTVFNRTKTERQAKIEELKKKIAIEGLDIGGNVKQGLSFSNAKFKLIAELGMEYVAMGITDFAKWSRLMKKDVDGITDDDLKHTWENETIEGNKLKGHALEVEKRKDVKLQITPEGKIDGGMRALLKHLISIGVDNIDDAIEAIKEKHPELTKRDITDAISGYGKTKTLTTDPFELKMQELTAISGMLSQLDVLEHGELPKTFRETRPKSEMERELREQINNLKREKQGELQGQVSPEHLRTLRDAWERRIQNGIDKLKKQIETGNIHKKVKEALQADAKMLELIRERDKLKGKIKNQLEKERLANRSVGQKFIDFGLKVWRAYLLKGLGGAVIKLVGGATIGATVITRPLDALMASMWASKISPLRKIADQSPRFSGDQAAPLAKGIAEMWSKETRADMISISKDIGKIIGNSIPDKLAEKLGYEHKDVSGKTTIEMMWGKVEGVEPTLLDVINVFHKLLKTPLKRSEFKVSFEKQLQWEAKQIDPRTKELTDISDPVVQHRSAVRALADSERAIFLNDNDLSNAYKMFMGNLARSKSPIAHGLRAGLEFDMPMVKVATNYALELAQRTGGIGIIEGLSRIADLNKNLDKLEPEQANAIMRAVVRGSTGLLLYGLGYYFYKNAGGGYVRSERKDKEKLGLKEGDMVVGGYSISHKLLHGTGVNTFELGAQQAWSEKEYQQKGAKFVKTDAFIDVLKVLGEEFPFVKGAEDISRGEQTGDPLIDKLTSPKSYLDKENERNSKLTPLQSLDKVIDDPKSSDEEIANAQAEKDDLQAQNKQDKINKLIEKTKDLQKQAKDKGKTYVLPKSLSEDEKQALEDAGLKPKEPDEE